MLEDELRQYAHKRMAELQRTQARADARKTAGPPPELKQVRMVKIDARHFTIMHGERTIGDVSRADDGRWLACLYGADGDQAYAWGKTRRLAVTVLLSQEIAFCSVTPGTSTCAPGTPDVVSAAGGTPQ